MSINSLYYILYTILYYIYVLYAYIIGYKQFADVFVVEQIVHSPAVQHLIDSLLYDIVAVSEVVILI